MKKWEEYTEEEKHNYFKNKENHHMNKSIKYDNLKNKSDEFGIKVVIVIFIIFVIGIISSFFD